ncbi:hypothetical protein EWB00_009282 [Schistosoma japonicum]|uniref:Uncharacterized protein n=1 Tax=Schistosoma japonicum TaxID=6182 RepID=A0A4Z2CN14_SCHJA|nr:hypothetical protein EWB00_009282 [Schistosoma japonicum]
MLESVIHRREDRIKRSKIEFDPGYETDENFDSGVIVNSYLIFEYSGEIHLTNYELDQFFTREQASFQSDSDLIMKMADSMFLHDNGLRDDKQALLIEIDKETVKNPTGKPLTTLPPETKDKDASE